MGNLCYEHGQGILQVRTNKKTNVCRVVTCAVVARLRRGSCRYLGCWNMAFRYDRYPRVAIRFRAGNARSHSACDQRHGSERAALEGQSDGIALFGQAFLELAREFLVVLHNQNSHLRLCSIDLITEKLVSLRLLSASSAPFPEFCFRISRSRQGLPPSKRNQQYAASSLGAHQS